FAVSATGGAHLCSIQYYLRFWLGICRTSLAVSALRIMRYCPNAFIDIFHLPNILIIPYLPFSPSNQKHPRSLPVSPGKGNGDAFYRFKPNQQSRCIKQAHRQRRAGHQPNG
ncbi:MAG: hypothetical protein KBE47_04265, partial [Gemmiger sp.]|nr:hypothetical protein [Gemmiger sp.]